MKIKKKGAYMTPELRQPHQNVSKMIVPVAAEKYLIDKISIEDTITNWRHKNHHDDDEDMARFDFMISTKIPRSSRLVTMNVELDGYEYDLYNGYDKLPTFKDKSQTDEFDNEYDFIALKGNKSIKLGAEIEQNRVARYIVSKNINDPFLVKIMPPLKDKEDQGERWLSPEAGRHVKICTNVEDFCWNSLCYEYYITEAKKLINLPERKIEDL